MSHILHQIYQVIQYRTDQLFFVGLIWIGLYNRWLWQRDKVLVKRLIVERSRMPKLSCMPKISALVAAWNEHDCIDDHICSFLNLCYPNIELILCAGGTDDTFERAQRYACPRVIILEQRPGEGKQRALADCLEFASGEIIYLIDADCLYVDEALTRLLVPLVNQGEQVATGTIQPLHKQSNKLLPSYLYATDAVSSAHQPVHIEGLLGANAMIHRQALDRIGDLDFIAPTGTDYHLARRLVNAGIKICYVPTSVVPTEYPKNFNAYVRERSRWLRNLLIYGPQYNAKRDVGLALKTVVIGVLMLFAPLFTFAFGSIVLVVWSLLVTHAILSKLRYVLFVARLNRRKISWQLLTSLTPLALLDFVTWTMPIIDLFSMKRRHRW